MRDHTKLRAFELADELVVIIYRITKFFPKEEIYGLTSQIRRAAVSVPTNIVEGSTRGSKTEYHRFLEMAFGSLREVSYQFGLSIRLDFISEQDINVRNCKSKITETEKVLAALLRSI